MGSMMEIHGVRVVKIAAANGEQDATVHDCEDGIKLALSGNSFPALLSADQADFLANMLHDAARRLRERQADDR